MEHTVKLTLEQYPDLLKFEQGIRTLVGTGFFQEDLEILASLGNVACPASSSGLRRTILVFWERGSSDSP